MAQGVDLEGWQQGVPVRRGAVRRRAVAAGFSGAVAAGLSGAVAQGELVVAQEVVQLWAPAVAVSVFLAAIRLGRLVASGG